MSESPAQTAPMIEHRNKQDEAFREMNSRALAEFGAAGYVMVRADDLAVLLLTSSPAPTAARRRLAAVLDEAVSAG